MKPRTFFLFLVSALLTFWLAFGPLGQMLSEKWSALFVWWSPHGLLGALWTVACMLLGLLPQLLILFSFFYFVEKQSPPALLRIIMGFGCGTVAVNTLSGIGDKDKRTRTAVLLSFIPCSAQMPVILLLLAGTLDLSFIIIFLFYLGTVLIGLFISRLSAPNRQKDSVLKSAKTGLFCPGNSAKTGNYCSKTADFCFKNADFHPENGKKSLEKAENQGYFVSIFSNVLQFFKRISGTVLIAAGILYFLSSYDFHFRPAPLNESALFYICDIFSPLFIPLGFNAAVIAVLIFGILGKEMAAAAILMLAPFETSLQIITFVIFYMLYPPCIANIKAIAVQTDRKTAFLSVSLNFAAAYLSAFLFYMISTLILLR